MVADGTVVYMVAGGTAPMGGNPYLGGLENPFGKPTVTVTVRDIYEVKAYRDVTVVHFETSGRVRE